MSDSEQVEEEEEDRKQREKGSEGTESGGRFFYPLRVPPQQQKTPSLHHRTRPTATPSPSARDVPGDDDRVLVFLGGGQRRRKRIPISYDEDCYGKNGKDNVDGKNMASPANDVRPDDPLSGSNS